MRTPSYPWGDIFQASHKRLHLSLAWWWACKSLYFSKPSETKQNSSSSFWQATQSLKCFLSVCISLTWLDEADIPSPLFSLGKGKINTYWRTYYSSSNGSNFCSNALLSLTLILMCLLCFSKSCTNVSRAILEYNLFIHSQSDTRQGTFSSNILLI